MKDKLATFGTTSNKRAITDGEFQDGFEYNSILESSYLNGQINRVDEQVYIITQEIVNLLEGNGVTIDPSNNSQLAGLISNLNDNAVHKTGDESIDGRKSFLKQVFLGAGEGIRILGTDYSYCIRSRGTPSNGMGIFLNNSTLTTAMFFSDSSVKIGSTEIPASTPTQKKSDNSERIASTAFVKNLHQQVNVLPASPDSNVFYYIPE